VEPIAHPCGIRSWNFEIKDFFHWIEDIKLTSKNDPIRIDKGKKYGILPITHSSLKKITALS
jgi:hypothetical protein